MASTNQSPFYQRAEQEFHKATTDEERIACLEIMMKEVPKHKSSENMRKNLTNRYKRLKNNLEKQKKAGKSSQKGIKKADMQTILLGFPNTGKSTIFNTLTNKNSESKTSPNPFTTYKPILGTINFEDVQIQLIDNSPFPNHNKSLINSTDTILLITDNLEQINPSLKLLEKSARADAKIILIFNKTDKLTEKEIRKIKETIKSKHKIDFFLFSNQPTQEQINELKQKIFQTFPIIRIYTKEPHKPATKTPMILKQNSTLRIVAEKILKGMSQKIKQTKIWGPSSKFQGQTIGLNHVLKDKDIVEFQVR